MNKNPRIARRGEQLKQQLRAYMEAGYWDSAPNDLLATVKFSNVIETILEATVYCENLLLKSAVTKLGHRVFDIATPEPATASVLLSLAKFHRSRAVYEWMRTGSPDEQEIARSSTCLTQRFVSEGYSNVCAALAAPVADSEAELLFHLEFLNQALMGKDEWITDSYRLRFGYLDDSQDLSAEGRVISFCYALANARQHVEASSQQVLTRSVLLLRQSWRSSADSGAHWGPPISALFLSTFLSELVLNSCRPSVTRVAALVSSGIC